MTRFNLYTMKKPFNIFLLIILFSCQSKSSEVFTTESGALDGYDPVAYFTEGAPVRGDRKFSTRWGEAQWYFSSQANLDNFKADPSKYAPQYGGYCAFGTAEGHKAPTKPDAWTIVNDKLYLNYNEDVKAMWLKEQSKLIHLADSNWSTVKLME
jgi:YHS domain-containing protein